MSNKKHIQNITNKTRKEGRQSKITLYETIKDIIIPIIGIIATFGMAVITIVVYIEANKLSQEANLINKKSEPLIYSVKRGSSIGTYSFEYNDEHLEIPCKSFKIKVEQGVIDEIRFIKYDGKNVNIYDELGYDFMERFRKNNNIELEIETSDFKIKLHDGIGYDYFFIYIKSGDGTERLDLVYAKIDVNNNTVDDTVIENKLYILKLNNEHKDNVAYYEMIEVYKDIQDNFSDLLKSDMSIY